MRLYELAYICCLYLPLGSFDESLAEFRRRTRPALNIWKSHHRRALFAWLNAWGCRQFAKQHHGTAGRSLLVWGTQHLPRLPKPTVSLPDLDDAALDAAALAYGDLKERRASLRTGPSGDYPVTYGPTGAAKVFFALRPRVFPPWDDPIRDHFDYDGSAESYRGFLARVRRDIRLLAQDARRLHVPPGSIPRLLGRPDSTLVKLIDEYNWVTITYGVSPPAAGDLERWTRWARATPKTVAPRGVHT